MIRHRCRLSVIPAYEFRHWIGGFARAMMQFSNWTWLETNLPTPHGSLHWTLHYAFSRYLKEAESFVVMFADCFAVKNRKRALVVKDAATHREYVVLNMYTCTSVTLNCWRSGSNPMSRSYAQSAGGPSITDIQDNGMWDLATAKPVVQQLYACNAYGWCTLVRAHTTQRETANLSVP